MPIKRIEEVDNANNTNNTRDPIVSMPLIMSIK